MVARPHDRFSRSVTLTEADVAEFASRSGDENPLHHDLRRARASRYGGLIASGPQTSSLLMGLCASHFSRGAEMVGLEFTFRFRSAVKAGERVELEWLVAAVRETSRHGTHIVDLYGRMRTESGTTAVGAKGRVLVVERPAE